MAVLRVRDSGRWYLGGTIGPRLHIASTGLEIDYIELEMGAIPYLVAEAVVPLIVDDSASFAP